MAHSPEPNPASPEAIRLGYEPQRISIRALLFFIVLFVASMIALQAMLVWLMRGIEARDARADAPRSLLTADQTPPSPRLQPSLDHDALDSQDLDHLRRQEDEMFSKLGWDVNRTTHKVLIPSEIARQVAEQEHTRATSPYIPPTTTGKDSNSTVPGAIPPYDTRPGINGGQRP